MVSDESIQWARETYSKCKKGLDKLPHMKKLSEEGRLKNLAEMYEDIKKRAKEIEENQKKREQRLKGLFKDDD